MKVLVTGATGFIGTHLINNLLKSNIEVIATSSNINNAKSKNWYDKVIYIEYNINNVTENNLFNYFQKPDIIIHLSWSGLPDYGNISHIENNLWSNYYFLKNLIQNGAKKITVTGTCFEYGMVNGEIPAYNQPNPNNSYSIAKDSLRKFLLLLQNDHQYELKWLRIFYLYGENQNPQSLFSQLNVAIENNLEYFNMSLGDQIRDFLSIETAVDNIIKYSLYKNGTVTANICSGKPITVRTFVENIIREKKSKIKLNLGYYQYSNFEPFAFWGKV